MTTRIKSKPVSSIKFCLARWKPSRLLFYLTCSRNLVFFCYSDGFVAWICLNIHWLLVVTGVMHEADDAYSIWSTWSCYWLDQFLALALSTLILSVFYILLDLSTIYFTHCGGCWTSFVCDCHSILECCVVFSGVKLSQERLSMRSFNLFLENDISFQIQGFYDVIRTS